ncbi:MAG: hydrolase, partial [Escherichia coli]|nr:hydrolase [Escherichia coli]
MQLNHIVKSLLITGLFTTSSLPLLAAEAPKDATAATQQENNLLYNQLPFSDNTDFTDAHKGFVAPIPYD